MIQAHGKVMWGFYAKLHLLMGGTLVSSGFGVLGMPGTSSLRVSKDDY